MYLCPDGDHSFDNVAININALTSPMKIIMLRIFKFWATFYVYLCCLCFVYPGSVVLVYIYQTIKYEF